MSAPRKRFNAAAPSKTRPNYEENTNSGDEQDDWNNETPESKEFRLTDGKFKMLKVGNLKC